MFSDPGHPQEKHNARRPVPQRRPPSARDGLGHECLIALAVLLGTLGVGWLFRLASSG